MAMGLLQRVRLALATTKSWIWDTVKISERDLLLNTDWTWRKRGTVVRYQGRTVILLRNAGEPTKYDPLSLFVEAKPYNPLTEVWARFLHPKVEAGQNQVFKGLKWLRTHDYIYAPEGYYPGMLPLLRTFTTDIDVRRERFKKRTGYNSILPKYRAWLEEQNAQLMRELHIVPKPL